MTSRTLTFLGTVSELKEFFNNMDDQFQAMAQYIVLNDSEVASLEPSSWGDWYFDQATQTLPAIYHPAAEWFEMA